MPLFKRKADKHADEGHDLNNQYNNQHSNHNQAAYSQNDDGPLNINSHHDHGHHAGVAIGSAALREQTLMKERESEILQAQSQELAEAERLEQEAREHRERAVAIGAHPANKTISIDMR